MLRVVALGVGYLVLSLAYAIVLGSIIRWGMNDQEKTNKKG